MAVKSKYPQQFLFFSGRNVSVVHTKQQRQVVFHPALELLGFINKKSPGYLSNVARAAVSSASFQAAASELSYRGIKVSAEQVRKMTYQHADLFMKQRIENVLDGCEKQARLILEISADGGSDSNERRGY